MSRRLLQIAAPVISLAVTAGAARAQPAGPIDPELEAALAADPRLEPEPALTVSSDLRDWGLSLSAGAGVTAFFDDDTQRAAHAGGVWDARLGVGADAVFGAELAYVGSAQSLDGLRQEDEAVLFGNGAELTVRADVPIAIVRPYIMAGIGWMHYQVAFEDTALASLDHDEDAWVMPVAAGVRYRTGPVLLDVRATVRSTVIGELAAPNTDAPSMALDSWTMTGRAGWVF